MTHALDRRAVAPVGSPLAPRQRTSFARRERNLALLGALLTGAVVALALTLLLLERADPEQGSRLRGAAADLLRPVHAVILAPARLVRSAADRLEGHWRTVARLRAAEAELALLRGRAAEAELLRRENARLAALLNLARPDRQVVATAMTSALAAQASQRSAIVSAGLAQGVRPGMPVLAAEGLAGRITDVGLGAARMRLLTDPASRVPVMVRRTGWTGLAVGTGGRLLSFETDQSGADAPRVGDRLVTSGDGGVFPPGVPVAVVVEAGPEGVLARPLVPGGGIGPVTIEAPWMPPPAPVPAADTAAALPGAPGTAHAAPGRPPAQPAASQGLPAAAAPAGDASPAAPPAAGGRPARPAPTPARARAARPEAPSPAPPAPPPPAAGPPADPPRPPPGEAGDAPPPAPPAGAPPGP